MPGRPASAVSLFTAIGAGVCLVLGVVVVLEHWASPWVLVWCGALAVVVGFGLWAARGRE